MSLEAVHAAAIAAACRAIESADVAPSLNDLAARAGLSPFHFHRIFKAKTGLTPKAYATANRHKRVRENLTRSGTVTEAIYESGFNSSGRFYANARNVLGMSPKDYKAGGANSDIRFAVGSCSLGSILVAATEKGVAAVLLGDDAESLLHDLQDRFPRANLIGGDRKFEKIAGQVIGAIEQPGRLLDLPLDVQGTAFQHKVWTALKSIPLGATASYSDVARRIGAAKSVRAVARACAANPIAVVIPCHRVIRTDGSISGYRWGLERKRALLQREAEYATPKPSSRRRG
jgi:AraC family transcriptional regulator of adaptative response/methylated-DNA-[protein]-cysteine methyltransferase